MALGADNATTYILALNTIWALGSLFERQADLAKARVMYSKALVGYENIVGPNHPRSQSLRDRLCALDPVTENRASTDLREPENNLVGKTLHLEAKETLSKSKRRKQLEKLGLR
jgi:hypothetical protein